MARICTCGSFCVYLIILFRILSVVSQNDYYFHEIDDTKHQSTRLDLVLLDDRDLHRQKRNVPDPACTDESMLNSTQSPTTTTAIIPPIAPNKQLANPQTIILKEDRKNLGVNGTGQRKNITVAISPPPLIQNSTSPTIINKTEDDNLETTTPPFPSLIDTECGEKEFNKTLHNHNITTSKTDNYEYYNSSFYNDENVGHYYWINFENRSDVKTNKLLSNSHRRAATVKLSFEFPFYGHLIQNVTIATGGFLYTGDYVHSWLAATQYIAPLMANFDTSLSNDSYIKYFDNGTAFTVEWEKVTLQEKPDEGEFTFQVTLKNNGDIIFVYNNVPLFVKDIQDYNHPVKVGLSDAYILDRTVFFIRRKTIFEYHRVDFSEEDIRNWTVIYLKALPTCLDNHDCSTCLTRKVFSSSKCIWCPTLQKCSNGYDRHRQDWTRKECDKNGFESETMCSQVITVDSVSLNSHNDYNSVDDFDSAEASEVYSTPIKKQSDDVGISGIVAILFLVAMVTGLAFWVFYAYRNPHTTSGQILIRYRPSQWRWRRGEARYTAATIHM